MSVSILVVDDEPDVTGLFRQRFHRETRQGKYVLCYAALGSGGTVPAHKSSPRNCSGLKERFPDLRGLPS